VDHEGAEGSKVTPSITIEPFNCLHLDIKGCGVHSLEDALTALAEPESLEGFAVKGQQAAPRVGRGRGCNTVRAGCNRVVALTRLHSHCRCVRSASRCCCSCPRCSCCT
jgi:hypothetical protein